MSMPVGADRCVDCSAENPPMHNNREIAVRHVKGLPPSPVTKMFPGYLCVECWRKANPVLFELGPYAIKRSRQRAKPVLVARIMWALFAIVVLVGLIASFVAK